MTTYSERNIPKLRSFILYRAWTKFLGASFNEEDDVRYGVEIVDRFQGMIVRETNKIIMEIADRLFPQQASVGTQVSEENEPITNMREFRDRVIELRKTEEEKRKALREVYEEYAVRMLSFLEESITKNGEGPLRELMKEYLTVVQNAREGVKKLMLEL